MRGRHLATLIAVGCVAAPGIAQAQKDSTPPKIQKIEAVERGMYFEGDVGFNIIVNKIEDRSYGLGMIAGVFAGYDITPIFSVSVGAQALVASGSNDEPLTGPRGDLAWLTPMVAAQVAVLTTERDFLWVRAAAGLAFAVPNKIGEQDFGGVGPAFSGTLVYEHYTKLRHFSVGAQAGVQVVTAPGLGIGVSAMPIVKYTF